MAENVNPNRARDHLANERTFLAWVRTGAAIVVFGFAIGRFAIAIRQLTALQGHPVRTAGISVWLGSGTIAAGVVLVVAGLLRYRRTRAQLAAGTFEPAGFVLHGHGTGVLKSAIRDHLGGHRFIARARSADDDQGGDAFTVFWIA